MVTFGEVMLRLSTERGSRLVDEGDFRTSWAGSEANVAVALAALGVATRFVTALPNGSLGDRCLRSLRAGGVDCAGVLRENGRMGLFFVETGALIRPSRVVYDRSGSTFANVGPDAYDWSRLLEETNWLHVSAITLALSPNTRDAARRAMEAASQRSVKVSLDLNYRRSLWSSEEQARQVIGSILPFVDCLIGNEEELSIIVNGEPPVLADDVEKQVEGMRGAADAVLDRFPNVHDIFSSIRIARSAEKNLWSGAWFRPGRTCAAACYRLHDIVDRLGSGDAFAAGVISSMLDGHRGEDVVEFATAIGALKHTIHGDFLVTNRSEVMAMIPGSGQTARIQR